MRWVAGTAMAGALVAGASAAASAPAGGGVAPALTEAEARHRAARVSRVHYDLRLDLAVPGRPDSYTGRAQVSFVLTGDPAGLFLDFQGREVTGLRVNGRAPAGPVHRDHRIPLPPALLKPGRNNVTVRYRCDYDTDGAGLHRVDDPADGRRYLFTHFEPFDANRVFPCFDQPDLKATYALEVAAPAGWTVVSGGALREVRDGRVHVFARTRRYSPYIFALAAGPFRVWEDPDARYPSRVLVTESMARYADPAAIFRVTRRGFDFFEGYFGIPYPFGKYDQVFVPQFNWGAMENVGCVVFNDRMIFRHNPTREERMRRANTILHELAHMWFGDIVTMKWWNDLWLNESFATFMAHLALAEATRFDDAWANFARRTKAWAYWQDRLPTTHPIETPVPDTRTTFDNFDGITYGKGAAALKQLRFLVGPAAFREGVAAYLREHRWGNATRADFLAAIGAAAGRDLGGWTREWLQAAGTNTITPEFETRPGPRGPVMTGVALRQGAGNGAAIHRTHRLEVALYDRARDGGALRLRGTYPVTVAGPRTPVPALEGAPAPDFVYANHGDHAFARVFLDPRSLAAARAHLPALPDVMTRAAVWQALWFMVDDRAERPREFLRLVATALPEERDAGLVSTVLGRARTALDHYLLPADRAGLRRDLAAVAWRAVAAARPGSDRQKEWFDFAVRGAETAAEAARLAGYFRGEAPPRGIALDQPLRWRLLRQLAAAGHPETARLLAAERRRDPGQKGVAQAFRVEASRPDPAAKAAAWARFTGDATAPLDLLREGMRGFWWPHQAATLRPYAGRFFAALRALPAARGAYFREAFADLLFPAYLPEPAVVAAAEGYLDSTEPDAAGPRRQVRESLDDLRRAAAVRAAQER